MSTNEIMQKISQGGREGVRKTEITKEFQKAFIDDAIESLLKNGSIVMEKKGSAYYLWQSDYYLEYLLTTDTKFKLLYNRIEETKVLLENSLGQGLVSADANASMNCSHDPSVTSGAHCNSFDYDKFRQEFDLALRRYSGSSGWVPLSSIREEMERKCNLGPEEFYAKVEEMTNKEYDSYELSSGGIEGITVRGLLHGFVRCI